MAIVTVPAGGTTTISSSENDSLAFVGTGTLNIAGSLGNTINVGLASVIGAGVSNVINMTYANVTLTGIATGGIATTYNIGTGATLNFNSTLGVSLNSTINFTGPKSHLVVASGVNLTQLGGITGFGPGNNIDIKTIAATSFTYADAAGTGTGGVLTLVNGGTTTTVTLASGEFTAASFNVHADGTGGTLIDFATYVSSLTAVPSTADLMAGGNVVFQLATTGPVTIAGGVPTLTLNDGGIATYDAASSTGSTLVFRYTVQSGQNTPDLTVSALNLNGATATDLLGNTVSLAGGVGNPAGILQIDTIAPTITSVSTTPGSGTLVVGQSVTFNVTPSEAVTVSGSPLLTLSDGGIATYDAGSSTATNLVFRYTVQPGRNSPDLAIVGVNLNGGTVVDLAGNVADLTGLIVNPPGILVINTPPTITSIVATPADAYLKAGGTFVIQLNISKPVTVTGGIPTLALSDGGLASYDAASSTPTTLVFRSTVQNGQNSPDLSVTAALFNGATITDASGNSINLGGAVGNPAGTLVVDTILPTVINFAITGSLGTGGIIYYTFTYSEDIILTGNLPTFVLANGRLANVNLQLSTPRTVVFTYAAQPGDTDASITLVSINLNGNVLSDRAGNVVDSSSIAQALTASQGNFSGVTNSAPHTIDVYRFFDQHTGTHFYTQDAVERATILATRPDLTPEGPNGVGLQAIDSNSNDASAVPVYRFFDLAHGTQFLTASSLERDSVIASRSDLRYEPTSLFYEHTTQQAGDTAVYRFFDTKFGTHFYTDDATERANIIATRPDLVQEGVGFYEPARNPA